MSTSQFSLLGIAEQIITTSEVEPAQYERLARVLAILVNRLQFFPFYAGPVAIIAKSLAKSGNFEHTELAMRCLVEAANMVRLQTNRPDSLAKDEVKILKVYGYIIDQIAQTDTIAALKAGLRFGFAFNFNFNTGIRQIETLLKQIITQEQEGGEDKKGAALGVVLAELEAANPNTMNFKKIVTALGTWLNNDVTKSLFESDPSLTLKILLTAACKCPDGSEEQHEFMNFVGEFFIINFIKINENVEGVIAHFENVIGEIIGDLPLKGRLETLATRIPCNTPRLSAIKNGLKKIAGVARNETIDNLDAQGWYEKLTAPSADEHDQNRLYSRCEYLARYMLLSRKTINDLKDNINNFDDWLNCLETDQQVACLKNAANDYDQLNIKNTGFGEFLAEKVLVYLERDGFKLPDSLAAGGAESCEQDFSIISKRFELYVAASKCLFRGSEAFKNLRSKAEAELNILITNKKYQDLADIACLCGDGILKESLQAVQPNLLKAFCYVQLPKVQKILSGVEVSNEGNNYKCVADFFSCVFVKALSASFQNKGLSIDDVCGGIGGGSYPKWFYSVAYNLRLTPELLCEPPLKLGTFNWMRKHIKLLAA